MPNLRNIIIITKTILNHEYEHIKGIKGIFTTQVSDTLYILFYILLFLYFYNDRDSYAYKYFVNGGLLEIMYLYIWIYSVYGMYYSSFFVNDHVIYCQDRINKFENYKIIELLLSNILSCAIIFIIRVLPIIIIIFFHVYYIDSFILLTFVMIIWLISSNILYTSLDLLMLVYKQKIIMPIKFIFLSFNILIFFISDNLINKTLIISFTPEIKLYTILFITALLHLFLSSILFFLSSQKLQQKLLSKK